MVASSKFFFQVKTFCRNLLVLKVEDVAQDFSSAFVDLVVSYSSQLQAFQLGYFEKTYLQAKLPLTLVHYQAISCKCPNLKCSVSCSWEHSPLVMDGLTDCLDIIRFGGGSIQDMNALQVASAKGASIREIRWIGDQEEGLKYLKSLVPLVSGSVRSLDIDTWSSGTLK